MFSTGGALGWKFWEYFPIVASAIISVVSLIKQLEGQIIFNDSKLAELNSIQNFYDQYYNRLEKLLYDYKFDLIDEQTAMEKFYEIKQSEADINSVVNKIIIAHPAKLVRIAKEKTDEYLTLIFLHNEPETATNTTQTTN